MRTYAQAVARAEYLRVHPSADVLAGGHCQGVARDIVGAAPWASSALSAWNAIPTSHRFDLAHARPGMLGYAAYRDSAGRPKQYGHAFVLCPSHYVYSTDLPVAHRLGKVPLSLITGTGGWHMPLLGFTDWTPSGRIALAPTTAPPVVPRVSLARVRYAALHDPSAPQGRTTYPADVKPVETALLRLGLLPGGMVDGSYGTLTIEGYARWQRQVVGAPYDGIPGLVSLQKLGARTGLFTVGA